MAEDGNHFLKENWAMLLVTVLVVIALGWFVSSEVFTPTQEPAKPLPDVPAPIQRSKTVNSPSLPAIPSQADSSIPAVQNPNLNPKPNVIEETPLPVRPAQEGDVNLESAKEAAYEIINKNLPPGALPSKVRVGISFFTLNPDGSTTAIPESDLSFTIMGDGTMHSGIANPINVKISMPASRLFDIQDNFCAGLTDTVNSGQAQLDISGLDAFSRMQLIASALSMKTECESRK